MSLVVRLSRIGKKNRPSYRVVVAEKRGHQSGKVVEYLGFFDPHNPETFKTNKERMEYWKGKGAVVGESVEKILNGKYKFKKYVPISKNERAA